MRQWLAPAHLVLTLVIIVWDVVLAGHIAQRRQASKPFAAVTGLAALLLIPAFIVAVATTTLITGRAISAIDWVWPATVLLFTAQSVYALARRLANPLWGYPIAFYNVLVAIASASRYLTAHGVELPHWLLVIMAAQIDSLALTTTDAAITSPFYLHVPLIAPAFPALRRVTAGFRMTMASLALAWFGFIVAEIPRADVALASYDSHADDRLTERTRFGVGVKVFPDVESAPSVASVKTDVELAAAVAANVLSVTFMPGASAVAIDSVARSLDLLQRDSMLVVATIGYGEELLPELSRAPLDVELRLRTLRAVLVRLRPDIVLPAQDPYGLGARVLGRMTPEQWEDYLTSAKALVREVRPRTRVGLAAAAFDARDSTLYAWAAAPGSPVDVVGFSFYPSRLGARTIDASFRAADRWMRANPPRKPHWVFAAAGYPLAHGEQSQARAIWAALAWATARPQFRGVIVMEANDYGQALGLRAPNGRYRRAATTVRRAMNGLRDAAGSPGAAPMASPP